MNAKNSQGARLTIWAEGPPRQGEAQEQVSFGFRSVSPAEKRRLVDQQFDAVARRYDLADAVLSFGLDSRWRKSAVASLALRTGDRVLDLCGGTAGLALLAAGKVAPGGSVTVCDINPGMMAAGKARVHRSPYEKMITWTQGDAGALSFRDSSFDTVLVGFGVRNFVHLEQGLREILRVLKPGGRIMILEFSLPRDALLRALYRIYSFNVMPFVGRVVTGAAGPFTYLAESIRVFPSPEELKATLETLGFGEVVFRRFTNGIAVAYSGLKV